MYIAFYFYFLYYILYILKGVAHCRRPLLIRDRWTGRRSNPLPIGCVFFPQVFVTTSWVISSGRRHYLDFFQELLARFPPLFFWDCVYIRGIFSSIFWYVRYCLRFGGSLGVTLEPDPHFLVIFGGLGESLGLPWQPGRTPLSGFGGFCSWSGAGYLFWIDFLCPQVRKRR